MAAYFLAILNFREIHLKFVTTVLSSAIVTGRYDFTIVIMK